jgi:hypothetical protein
MQAANEFQNSSEYFVASSESNLPHAESELLSENEPELELFLNKLRDNEFEAMLQETLQESEANFENYANQHGLQANLKAWLLNQILITL